MPPIPSLQEARQYEVTKPLEAEGIRQSLYDFNLYATAGIAQLPFFTQAQGQGFTSSLGAVVGSAKTVADTNMVQGGSLPNPQHHLMESIEMMFVPGASAAANTFTLANINAFAAAASALVGSQNHDVNTIYNSGSVQLFISSKTYLWEAPIGRFPPKTRTELDAAVATNSATVGEVAMTWPKAGGRPYYLEPPLFITPVQNFVVNAIWPGVLPTPSGFNGRIGAILDGYLYRASQ